MLSEALPNEPMPKLKSAKWAKNYQKGRIDWWTEPDHMWNQVYLLDDADDYIDTLATGAGDVWGGEPPVKDETKLPSNWRAHLQERRREREKEHAKNRVDDYHPNVLTHMRRLEKYRSFAESKGLPEHHIKAVLKEMGGDVIEKMREQKAHRIDKALHELKRVAREQEKTQSITDGMARSMRELPLVKEIKRKQLQAAETAARHKLKRDEARYNTLHSYYYEQTWRHVEFMGMIFPTGEIKDVD